MGSREEERQPRRHVAQDAQPPIFGPPLISCAHYGGELGHTRGPLLAGVGNRLGGDLPGAPRTGSEAYGGSLQYLEKAGHDSVAGT